MNDFEGINTGKWLVRETLTSWEAECPVCGFCVPVAVSFDFASLRHKICGLKDFCPSCNENMFKEESKLYTKGSAFAVGSAEPSSKSLVINCEKITLEQRSLGIVIDISESIENIDTVEINGIKFTREV
jgi:hypothetical protein